ncbi:alpha/beta hydrolase family protein [Actinocorallia sp. A-T 12471]|uniref:alpha/beta hydrolase n=1 Tax=Actinocorallia sp. A-T 12471 TaxID=3089813 RepID=UPI0029CFA363|nr:alpha/beta hydrolase family protein [Actinocorallia sp. A-T 12471]MDX6738473.1 alpha/beta hydrolase family protein [Actinocorallia sp. A-T 12471]
MRRAHLPHAVPAVAVLCAAPLLCSSAEAVPAVAAPASLRPADSGAKIVKVAKAGKYGRDLTVSTPNLDRRVKVRVLLPKSWRKNSSRKWPVLYVYSGGDEDYRSWSRQTRIEQWSAGYDAIVVMPEAASSSYTNWFNGGKKGNPRWETFHTKDVIQLIERNYRTNGRRSALGVSAGGMGAMRYAARNPKMYKFVAALSSPLWLTGPGIPVSTALAVGSHGQSIWDVYGDPVLDRKNWLRNDPYELAPGLRGTKIYFSSGTTGRPGPGDPPVSPLDVGLSGEKIVGDTNKAFRKRLRELKIPHTAYLYGDGRHNWPAWKRILKDLWPQLMKSIGAKKVPG